MQLNGLNNFFIYPGQKLKVTGTAAKNNTKPSQSSKSSIYTVQPGDSLSLIASKYNTTYQKIMQLNGLNNFFIYPGQKLKVTGTASGSSTRTSNSNSYRTPILATVTYIHGVNVHGMYLIVVQLLVKVSAHIGGMLIIGITQLQRMDTQLTIRQQ